MPSAKKNILDNGSRKELLPKENDAWLRHICQTAPPGQGSPSKRVLALYEKDPAAFIFGGAVRTFDEHDNDHPYKPFPDEPDLRELLDFIHSPAPVACVAKSRQLMVTWMICAYSVWLARFHPAKSIYIQCKTKEDAKTLVFEDEWLTSRCAFIEYAMPPLLWQSFDGRFTTAKSGKLVYPHGSKIVSIPAGAHHLRGKVGSLVVIDEAAFMMDFEDTYQAALAMTKGGGRMRIISTARYNTYFGTLIEATEMLAVA